MGTKVLRSGAIQKIAGGNPHKNSPPVPRRNPTFGGTVVGAGVNHTVEKIAMLALENT